MARFQCLDHNAPKFLWIFWGCVAADWNGWFFSPFKNCLVPLNLEKCNILMIIFDCWELRNLSSWTSAARVCWWTPVQYLPQLSHHVCLTQKLRFKSENFYRLFTDALLLCVPCRRSSREAVLLHFWAVTGMHFPNHLTSRAYLCFWMLGFGL